MHVSAYKHYKNVFGSVLRKNVLEYIRYPVNFISSLFMPVIWTLPVYFLIISFSPDGSSAGLLSWTGSGDFFGYFMIGMVVSYIIMTIFWNIGYSLKRLMDIGLLETIWVYPVPKILYILAESLFSLCRLGYELILLAIVFRFLYGMSLPISFFRLLPWFIPFSLLMYGFGIGFAAIVLLAKDANTLVDTSSFLTSTITGTNNPPQAFPRFIMIISLAIPITYFIDFLRVQSMGITPLAPLFLEKIIILAGAVLMPLLGVWFFKFTERRCRVKGNLHVH